MPIRLQLGRPSPQNVAEAQKALEEAQKVLQNLQFSPDVVAQDPGLFGALNGYKTYAICGIGIALACLGMYQGTIPISAGAAAILYALKEMAMRSGMKTEAQKQTAQIVSSIVAPAAPPVPAPAPPPPVG